MVDSLTVVATYAHFASRPLGIEGTSTADSFHLDFWLRICRASGSGGFVCGVAVRALSENPAATARTTRPA